jgi:hypothetical protein
MKKILPRLFFMRRTIVTLSCGFLALAVGLLVTLAPAPDTTARELPDCVGQFTTAVEWGNGGNCGAATQDLFDKVVALAEQTCGTANVCNAALVITTGCHNSSPVMVDGKLQHGCLGIPW